MSILYHQKVAKFCFQLQNKSIKIEDKFICKDCNKEFLVKKYDYHVSVCKEKNKLKRN